MKPDLRVKIGSIEFQNPVMTASGTFGYGLEFQEILDLSRLGAIITKSLTLEERAGTRPPRIVETPSGMLNAIGLANVGLKRFIEEKLPHYKNFPTKVIVNVAGSTPQEYFTIVKRLSPYREIAAFEINFSCPNVKEGGICFGVDPTIAHNLTGQLRKLTPKPLIIKLTPNVTSPATIARAVEDAGADAVSLINTLVGMAVDIKTWRPKLANITGGLSGPAIKPVALAQVWEVSQAVQIPVIGIGGIGSWEDAIEFFLAGATAIQVGTMNFVDPLASVKIVSGIEEYLKRLNLSGIHEVIGKLKS